MEPEVVGHTTFMGCVSATGVPSGSLLIFQGVRPLSKFTRQWSDCPFAMDLKGYMTQEIFFSWAVRWEEETRPADLDEPRCLFLDNHYSHFAVDCMNYMRTHNVRVVALHPHTTHLLCALDCGIFRSFKAHLNTAVHNLGHVATIDDVSGLIKEAWGKAMTITKNPLTGAEDSVAIRAFKNVGLAPFNRDVLSDKEYGYTDLYKSEHAEDGPNKKPRLSLSVEELQKRRADILSDYKKLPEDVVAAAKRAPRTGMAEIYTYSGTIIKEAEKSEVKEEEAKRKANYPWVLAGVSRKIWTKTKKDEKDKKAQEEKAAKGLKKAEEALALAAELAKKKADAAQAIAKVAAAPPLPKPVPKAMPAPAKVAAPVAQRQIGKRGIKRPRPHDEM